MKKLLFIGIGCIFAIQTTFASPLGDKIDFETLNKVDSIALFGKENQKTFILKKNELSSTKAKYYWNVVDIENAIAVYHSMLMKKRQYYKDLHSWHGVSFFQSTQRRYDEMKMFNIHQRILMETRVWLPTY